MQLLYISDMLLYISLTEDVAQFRLVMKFNPTPLIRPKFHGPLVAGLMVSTVLSLPPYIWSNVTRAFHSSLRSKRFLWVQEQRITAKSRSLHGLSLLPNPRETLATQGTFVPFSSLPRVGRVAVALQ